MPGTGRRSYECLICNTRTKASNRRFVNEAICSVLQKKLFIEAHDRDVICNKCFQKYIVHVANKKTPETTHETVRQNDNTGNDPDWQPGTSGHRRGFASPPSVTLNIPSASKSHSRCIICKKPGPKLIVVPSNVRFSAFLDKCVIISAGSRCCPGHIKDNKINTELLEHCSSSHLNRKNITDLLYSLRDACKSMNGKMNFDSLSDSDYSELTGLSKTDFDNLCSLFTGQVRDTPVRSVRTTVGIFLLKLKSGMSNKLLATICGLTKASVRRAIHSARKHLMKTLVPHHLGFAHVTREDIINNHTRPLAQTLFGQNNSGDGPKLILVLDGTYIYIQKSQNFLFQRRSYSMHKGRPLVKPMVIVSTTGYFISIVGPYMADGKNSDAKILNHMLQTNIEQIKEYVQSEDIFVVDRGFRDSLCMLEDLGIKAEMPCFMKKGQKQHTCEDANSSRLVTKIRWVVESANARIKRWRYLDRVLPTNQVPHIGDFVRIVCALSNKYSPPLCSAENSDSDLQLGSQMLQLSKQINILQKEVEQRSLDRKSSNWEAMDEDDHENFPRLTEEKLRAITCGVYQLKLSPCYMREHLDGSCNITVHKQERNLIRVRLQSRHVSAKQHTLWIRYTENDVTAWYCKCRAGSRVVGVCAHVASIIWYLGYGKHRFVNSDDFGIKNWGTYLADASVLPEVMDMSDSDSESSEE